MDALEAAAMMPATYDLLWSLALLAHLALVAAALWHFFRDRPQGLFALGAALLIIFLPLLGPGLYLLAQRGENASQRRREHRHTAPQAASPR